MRWAWLLLVLLACSDSDKEPGSSPATDPPDTTDATDSDPDADGDGFTVAEGDCDDDDPNISPTVTDLVGDGIDQNCDGADGFDGDGDGTASTASGGDDCDDEDPTRGSPLTWYQDLDSDGFGDSAQSVVSCSAPSGYVAMGGDCDDTSATLNPAQEWFADADADGFGDPNTSIVQCTQPSGHLLNDSDCDDSDANEYPGQTWYDDNGDGDGFGDPNGSVQACERPLGYSLVGGDCGVTAANVYPGAPESCDGVQTDCDGAGVPSDELDSDVDGYVSCGTWVGGGSTLGGDCDDTSDQVYPGAAEICDGRDNDCDQAIPDAEADLDGDGFVACTPAVVDVDGDDCDDSRADVYPGAPERCDGLDNDCNLATPAEVGSDCWDDDGDGYCEDPPCLNAAGSVPDCDDSSTLAYPGGTESGTPDGYDNDCDGQVDEGTVVWDDDGDGFCESPPCNNTNRTQSDCDDSNAGVNPAADEICGDDLDNDCDGQQNAIDAIGCSPFYLDNDGDTHGVGSTTYCVCGSGMAPYTGITNNDCDDDAADVHPGQTGWFSTAANGSFDYNCDGAMTRRYTGATSGCVADSTTCGVASPGWESGTTPACGQAGNYLQSCEADWSTFLLTCDVCTIACAAPGSTCDACVQNNCPGGMVCDNTYAASVQECH